MMNDVSKERATALGEYIADKKTTVRAAAEVFGVSKSTVHTDVAVRLKKINRSLYTEVREVLDTNKAQRHLRGGMATKNKYAVIKAENNKAEE